MARCSRLASFASVLLALGCLPAAAAAQQLDMSVMNGSLKLKHPQHLLLQLPDSATVNPVINGGSSKGITLHAGGCSLGFIAKATYEHVIGGGTLKQRVLDFGDFESKPAIYGQGALHNSKAKVGGAKILSGYQAAALSTNEPQQIGLGTYEARAGYRFSGGFRHVFGHRVRKPPKAETLIVFSGGLSLQEGGQPCAPADEATVKSDFAKAIAGAQLSG